VLDRRADSNEVTGQDVGSGLEDKDVSEPSVLEDGRFGDDIRTELLETEGCPGLVGKAIEIVDDGATEDETKMPVAEDARVVVAVEVSELPTFEVVSPGVEDKPGRDTVNLVLSVFENVLTGSEFGGPEL
jgi:hypothetical protein